MEESPFEDSVTIRVRSHSLAGLRQGSQESVYAPNLHLIQGAVSLVAKIHAPRIQGVEMDAVALTFTPTYSLAKVCFLSP